MEDNDRLKQGEKGAWVSIIAYIILTIIKLSIGSIGNSEGLFADGLNNSTDVVASVAVLIGLKISRKPADQNHLYGHNKAESIASLFTAFIMVTIGIQVLLGGFQTFFSDSHPKPDLLTAWTALVCAAIMFIISRYNLNLAQKTNSPSIKAVAYDNRSDALVSLGAFIGIIGTYIGIGFLDVIMAIIVGIIICKTAWEIFLETSTTLTDGFDTTKLRSIEQTILATPGVDGVSDVKARMHGSHILVESTIFVNPALNVVESHRITERVEQNLYKNNKVKSAIIHIEPFQKALK